MRAEELEKEAITFDKADECFIHVQRCKDGPFTQIVSGDPKVLSQAVYNIMCQLEQDYGVAFKMQLRIMRWAHRHLDRSTWTPIGGPDEAEEEQT